MDKIEKQETEMQRNREVFLCLFASLLLFLVGCSTLQTAENAYKIAVVAPQSGPYSLLGRSIIHGAELAVEEANKNGGIGGKKIILIKEDDGGLVGEGAFFAYRLTRTDMILGVIGHLNSDISIPASEFYRRAKIPQISPGSTSPYFTEREAMRGYVFRTIGRDDNQGKLLADYVIDHNFKRVVILYNDRDYGRSLAGEFAKSLKVNPNPNSRPQIVYYNMIEVGRTDYGALLSQLSSYSPDVVFLAGEHDDAGHLVKDFKKYGLVNTRFIGGDGIDNAEFIKIGGKNTEGAVVISPAPILDKGFVEEYKEHFNQEPTGYAANSYDAANILISAIKKVKEKSTEKIAHEISETKDFKGVTGTITFDKNGDLTSPGFVLSKVVEGTFKVIEDKNG